MSQYQILNFYLNCELCSQQEKMMSECPVDIPVKKVDVEKDDATLERYHVRHLPKLILVDSEGNEITRWEGVTKPQEINDYLYENGYAERTNIISQENVEAIKKLDFKLAGDFVVESMAGLGYDPMSEISEMSELAQLQSQFAHYCLKIKSNIIMDVVDSSVAHPVIMALKQHMVNYYLDSDNRNNPTMKWLYESDVKKYIIQQIGMMSLRGLLKNAGDISNLTSQEERNALDPDNVALFIGFYTYYTVLVNPNFSHRDFNEIFVESWYGYYHNFYSRLFMVSLSPHSWNNDFKGILMDI